MRKGLYYKLRYPMNFLQKEAHKTAVQRTKDYFKENSDYIVRTKDIDSILYCINFMIRNIGTTMRFWTAKDPSVVHFLFGYYRIIFPKLFIDMHKEGEFTDQEFKIITTEFYPEEFKQYYEIIKHKQQWRQKLKQKQKS